MSDLDKFEEAYKEFRDTQVPSSGSAQAIQTMMYLGLICLGACRPSTLKSWPLSRLTIPLSGFSKQLERLLEGYCMEVMVTNTSPELQLHDLVILFALHMAEKISSLLRQVLDHPTKVLSEALFLPLFWFLPIYRELLNTASRHRPSKNSELRRAASGLVKVLCKTVDSRAGGKGKRKGQPLKQGGALAGFNAWFGSMSMMNILYVWFPASWGPSVVEAIQKRNETWLAQNPVIRDPQMFNHSEVAMGPASRELTYKIQKWNVHSDGLHPILVANARVDWLALKDDEITRQFPSSTAAQWRDFLQSRRQFWPTLTTRHASLVPLCADALQRERRQMQSKHLWYELNKKLQVPAPTGLTREQLWRHLFVTKHRQNLFVEGKYKGVDYKEVERKWEATKKYFQDISAIHSPLQC